MKRRLIRAGLPEIASFETNNNRFEMRFIELQNTLFYEQCFNNRKMNQSHARCGTRYVIKFEINLITGQGL